MSWLQAQENDTILLDHVRGAQPEIYALARRLAPALRIESRLLRNARLKFFPQSDAGLEVAFWYCDLVESNSKRAVILRPGIAGSLTQDLLHDQAEFNESWQLIQQNTRHWPRLERLEQSLRLAAIQHPGQTDDRARQLTEALQELVHADQDARLDVARWAKYALPDIVSPTEQIPEATWLARFAAATLGDPGEALTRRSGAAEPLPSWLTSLLPTEGTENNSIDIRWRPGVLECLAEGTGDHTLNMITPLPAPIHIAADTGTGRWELLWPGRNIEISASARTLTLHSNLGARWQLTATQTASEAPAAAAEEETPHTQTIQLFYAPGDEDLSQRLAETLTTVYGADVSPHSYEEALDWATNPDTDVEQTALIGLWSANAQRLLGDQPSLPPALTQLPRALVLRTDDTPLPDSNLGLPTLDLRNWLREPSDEDHERLGQALRHLLASEPARQPEDETPPPQQDQVFVLHTRQGEGPAASIIDYLGRAGITVQGRGHVMVTDPGQIGQMLDEEVQAIRSALLVVAVITRDFEHDIFINKVLDDALLREQNIIPVLKEAEYPLPRQLKHLQAIALSGKGHVGLDTVVEAVLKELAFSAEILWHQGNLAEAIPLQEQVVEASRRVHGEEHPDTLMAMRDLAKMMWDVGDLAEAKPLEEQVLETSRRVLGEEHPDTLTAMYGLAEILQAQGDLAEARKLWERVFEISRRMFGENDPTTVAAMNNLTETTDKAPRQSAPKHYRAVDSLIPGRKYTPEIRKLLEELDNPSTPPQRRLEIGDQLAKHRDPRKGLNLDEQGLPDIDWVEVPASELLYGENNETRYEDSFYLARYPVTNTQYQAFIDAGGYGEDRWWEGLAERPTTPTASTWPEPNRPRTDLTWYEAMAYCRWLSECLGYPVSLPTETQWEKAARGTDGREYPWGDGYQAGYANVDETMDKGAHFLRQTSSPGLYPQGASPYGIVDLAGNVWEWCLNEYDAPDNIELTGDKGRVLRGGSWGSGPDDARCAIRRWSNPDDRGFDVGFRVLCSSPIVDH
jgi:tetratricopeptide (TPR) repeat protein